MKKELFESILNERSNIGAYEGSILLNPTKTEGPKKSSVSISTHYKITGAFDDLYDEADSPKEFATVIVESLVNSQISDDEIKALADELKDYISTNC